jgi:CheY-like chemotaxis protein
MRSFKPNAVLLCNAVKFTEKGRVIVRVAVKKGVPQGTRLVVEVEDTGAGIAEHELDKVFQYFEQTESGKLTQGGTGLGLAISREYARMMGGDITFASRRGEGSTFRLEVEIEVSEGCGEVADEKGLPPRVIGLEAGQAVPRVLVAEDVKHSRLLLVRVLQAGGMQVKAAANGKEAVELFELWGPDFIWMDIRMPMMDGRQAAHLIKSSESGKTTVIAALTAHALEEEKSEILSADFADFVSKPFREQEIFDVMARHLGLSYRYEGGSDEETVKDLRPEQLAALPNNLRRQLHEVALELNMGKALVVVEQISRHDAALGADLKSLVTKLAFDRLLALLEHEVDPHGDVQ